MILHPSSFTRPQLDTLRVFELELNRVSQQLAGLSAGVSGDIDAAIAIHTASADNVTDAELTAALSGITVDIDAAIAAHTVSTDNVTDAELAAAINAHTISTDNTTAAELADALVNYTDNLILESDMFPAGVVPDAALSANVALLDRDPQTFTGANYFETLRIHSAATTDYAEHTHDGATYWIELVSSDNLNVLGPANTTVSMGVEAEFTGLDKGSAVYAFHAENDAYLELGAWGSTAAHPEHNIFFSSTNGPLGVEGENGIFLTFEDSGADLLTTIKNGGFFRIADSTNAKYAEVYADTTDEALVWSSVAQYGFEIYGDFTYIYITNPTATSVGIGADSQVAAALTYMSVSNWESGATVGLYARGSTHPTSGMAGFTSLQFGDDTVTEAFLVIGNSARRYTKWFYDGLTTKRFDIQDGTRLRIFDGAETDSLEMYHDGTNFLSTFTNTASWTVSGNTAFSISGTVRFSSYLAGSLVSDASGNITISAIAPPASSVPATVQGDILYASATNVLSALAKDTNATRYLANTGTSNNPAWAQVALATGVSGDLPFANLTQGSAKSVLGVTGNATADFASIAGTTSQVLRVNAANTALAFQSSAALTKADDTNVTLTLTGTPTTALLDAVLLTLGWTGTLSVARGGIGVGTVTGILQGNGTSAVTGITNSSTAGQVLRVTGASTYAWGALDLADADAITGDLPDANLSANVALLNATNAFTATNTFVSDAQGEFQIRRSSTQYWDLWSESGGSFMTGISTVAASKSIFIRATTDQAGTAGSVEPAVHLRGRANTTIGMFQDGEVELNATILDFNGNLDVSGTSTLNGATVGSTSSWTTAWTIGSLAAPILLSSATPIMTFNESDRGTDLKAWYFGPSASIFLLGALSDSGALGSTAIQITRGATTTIASVELVTAAVTLAINTTTGIATLLGTNITTTLAISSGGAGSAGDVNFRWNNSGNQAWSCGIDRSLGTALRWTPGADVDTTTNSMVLTSSRCLVLGSGTTSTLDNGDRAGIKLNSPNTGSYGQFIDFHTSDASKCYIFGSDGELRLATVTAIDMNFYTTNTLRMVLTSDGRLYGSALHNNAGSVTGTTNQYVASGTYTPTLTNTTNVASSTGQLSRWIRVGNVVHVAMRVGVTATAASTVIALGISLPIASDIAAIAGLSGVGARQDGGSNMVVTIGGDLTNNRATLVFVPENTSAYDYNCVFSYTVL